MGSSSHCVIRELHNVRKNHSIGVCVTFCARDHGRGNRFPPVDLPRGAAPRVLARLARSAPGVLRGEPEATAAARSAPARGDACNDGRVNGGFACAVRNLPAGAGGGRGLQRWTRGRGASRKWGYHAAFIINGGCLTQKYVKRHRATQKRTEIRQLCRFSSPIYPLYIPLGFREGATCQRKSISPVKRGRCS